MIILKLNTSKGETLYYTTVDSLAEAHQEALEHGWAGAHVIIAEGIEEVDGYVDLEPLYDYKLDSSDYSASMRYQPSGRDLEWMW